MSVGTSLFLLTRLRTSVYLNASVRTFYIDFTIFSDKCVFFHPDVPSWFIPRWVSVQMEGVQHCRGGGGGCRGSWAVGRGVGVGV